MTREVPNLSHLSGKEVEKVAEAISSAKLRVILANRDEIVGMKDAEFDRISELLVASRDNCGGFGCG